MDFAVIFIALIFLSSTKAWACCWNRARPSPGCGQPRSPPLQNRPACASLDAREWARPGFNQAMLRIKSVSASGWTCCSSAAAILLDGKRKTSFFYKELGLSARGTSDALADGTDASLCFGSSPPTWDFGCRTSTSKAKAARASRHPAPAAGIGGPDRAGRRKRPRSLGRH